MGKSLRIFIAVLALLGLALLAGKRTAWAAHPESGRDLSVQAEASLSVSPDKDKDCKKDKDKDDHRDRRNRKKKDKCKDDDDHGSVKPPPDHVEICDRGDYSVGGVAVLQVKNLRGRERRDDDHCFQAGTQSSDEVSGIPSRAGTALTDLVVLESLGSGSSMKICFAVPPDKKVKIYASREDSWKGVGTSVKKGTACAQVPRSGSFVLVGK